MLKQIAQQVKRGCPAVLRIALITRRQDSCFVPAVMLALRFARAAVCELTSTTAHALCVATRHSLRIILTMTGLRVPMLGRISGNLSTPSAI